jgi:amidophosphoribosyltransferase
MLNPKLPMNPALDTPDEDLYDISPADERFDKLREECGVMAVYNHPDAARMTYWGLYALQHRGQESAGIASADGNHVNDIKGMGLVSEIFTDDVLMKLPGYMAIGHTRYSTTGDSALLNAQPISVESTKGLIAIAHNGNLINLGTSRTRLERDGAIFQTTSDSEIIVQLIAHSKENTLVDCIADSLSQVEGAFSIVMMTRNRVFAARDPRGLRPLSMGRIPGVDGAPDTFVFASETCAFDLLHAKYERDVKPGELVMVSEDGVTSRYFDTTTRQASCAFEHVYFARPDSRIYGRWVQQSREEMGRTLARESGVPADLIVPVPDSGVTAAIGYASESGIPFNLGLIRNHYVGRTFIQPEQRVRDFGVRMKLNRPQPARRQARHPHRRLHHPRNNIQKNRPHGPRRWSHRGPPPHLLSSHHFALLLRCRYPQHQGPHRREQVRRRDLRLHRSRLPRLPLARRPAA